MILANKIKDTFSKKENCIAFFFLLLSLFACFVVIDSYGIGIHNFDEYDFLEDIYFAEATIDAKSILNPNFYYTYRIPFGANLIMTPFVLILGPILIANKLGMLVFFAIYLVALFSLARALFKDFKSICYFVAIANMFTYTYCGDQFWHHIVYYNLAFVCLCGQLGCILNILKEKTNKANYIGLIIWLWWGAANGISICALSNVVTFIALLAFIAFKEGEIKKVLNKKYIKVVVLIIGFTLIGLISYRIATIRSFDIGSLTHKFTLVDADTMISNLFKNIFISYLEIFYVFSEGISLFSVAGIGIIIQILFAITLMIGAVIITIVNRKKYENDGLFVIISTIIVALICIAQYTITQDSNERYIINMVQSLFVLLGYNFVYLVNNAKRRKFIKIITLLFMFALSYRTIHIHNANNVELNKRKEIIDILKNNELYYGFAKKPGVFYTVSNGDIKTAGISITDSINAVSARSNIDEKYFNKPKNVEQFFILLDDTQLNDVRNKNSSLFKKAISIIKCNDYNIFVFDIELWDSVSKNKYN